MRNSWICARRGPTQCVAYGFRSSDLHITPRLWSNLEEAVLPSPTVKVEVVFTYRNLLRFLLNAHSWSILDLIGCPNSSDEAYNRTSTLSTQVSRTAQGAACLQCRRRPYAWVVNEPELTHLPLPKRNMLVSTWWSKFLTWPPSPTSLLLMSSNSF